VAIFKKFSVLQKSDISMSHVLVDFLLSFNYWASLAVCKQCIRKDNIEAESWNISELSFYHINYKITQNFKTEHGRFSSIVTSRNQLLTVNAIVQRN
jgi:hypothetical protein